MNYRKDHVKLLKVFAGALPKKPSFSVADLAKAAFSDIKKLKPDTALDADRACRNALRKPRALGHIEIVERGEYRLTTEGAALCRKLESYTVAPDKKAGEKVAKKAKAPKAAKVAKAPKAAKVAKAAKAAASKKVGRPAKTATTVATAKVDNTKPVARKRNLIPGLKPKAEPAVEAPVAAAPAAAPAAADEAPVAKAEETAPQLAL